MEHAKQHDALIHGRLESGELEPHREVGRVLEELENILAIREATTRDRLTIHRYQGIAHCVHSWKTSAMNGQKYSYMYVCPLYTSTKYICEPEMTHVLYMYMLINACTWSTC